MVQPWLLHCTVNLEDRLTVSEEIEQSHVEAIAKLVADLMAWRGSAQYAKNMRLLVNLTKYLSQQVNDAEGQVEVLVVEDEEGWS